jgi:hypothetical protein
LSLGCLVAETNADCLLPQLLASLVAALSLVASGMSLGFPAISLHQLQEEGLSEDDASWFGEKKSIVIRIITNVNSVLGLLRCLVVGRCC